jgi:hypothetical protein
LRQVTEGVGRTSLHTGASDIISVFLLVASENVGARAGIDTCPIVDCGLGPCIGRTEDGLHACVRPVLAEGGDRGGRADLHADVDLRVCEGSIIDGSIGIGACRLAGQRGIMTIEVSGALRHA